MKHQIIAVLPALKFVRRASWIARGHEGRTVVQFGKFKGRTFDEACDLYIYRTRFLMTRRNFLDFTGGARLGVLPLVVEHCKR